MLNCTQGLPGAWPKSVERVQPTRGKSWFRVCLTEPADSFMMERPALPLLHFTVR